MIGMVKRFVAGLYSAMMTLAVTVGMPVALVRFGGNPVVDLVQVLYERAGEPTSAPPVPVRPLAAVAGWLVWLLLVFALAIEVRARLRGVTVARFRLLRPLQGIAAAVVASQAAALLAPTAAAAAASAQPVHDSITHAAGVARSAPQHADRADRRGAVGDTSRPGRASLHDSAPAAGDCGTSYRVAKGDSLWRIADTCLDDASQWTAIWKLNKGKTWPHVSGHTRFHDPDLIFPRWVLTLPAGATRPPAGQPADPPVTAGPPTSAPSTSAPPTDPQPHSPTPAPITQSSGASGAKDTSINGSGAPSRHQTDSSSTTPTTTNSTTPAHDTPPGSTQDRQSADPRKGIDLPGGWITFGLGAGLLAAAATAWHRRRQHYQPTPKHRPAQDEPDLVPALAALTRIRRTLRQSAPDAHDTEPQAAPTLREIRAADGPAAPAPVGPTGSDLAGAGVLPLRTGLGLTGQGALAAARGLLVATLTAGSHDDPDAQSQAIIAEPTLTRLLGSAAPDLTHTSRITVTASVADAITALEERVIRRSRIISDAQATDVDALRDSDPYTEPLPQLLLICEVPDERWTARLSTAVRLGHAVDIGAVLLGDWPAGTTLSVAADGTTGDLQAERLAVLDAASTIELLHLLAEAHAETDTAAAAPAVDTHEPQRSVAAPPPDAVDPPDPDRSTLPTDAVETHLPVAVRILGRPAILGADGRPATGLRSAAVELLVYLAVNRNGADLRDIMEALFPDATMRRAAERLSTTVANLRKAIRDTAAARSRSGSSTRWLEPVVNTGGRYHLDPAVVTVDWWTLTDEFARAGLAATDEDRQLHLQAALAASTGPLADGTDYDWIDTDREAVRRRRIQLHTHAASLLTDRDPHQSSQLSEQACEIDPLSEELARTAMQAAARTGDLDAIRHRYTSLREALHHHGLELSDETRTLAADLLRNRHATPSR